MRLDSTVHSAETPQTFCLLSFVFCLLSFVFCLFSFSFFFFFFFFFLFSFFFLSFFSFFLCHVEDDEYISAFDVFYEKDGRENRCIGEVLEWYRGEDAGDLARIELNELVENWARLGALGRKIWKIHSLILMEEKSW